MYDEKGQLVWETHLDIYGKVRTFAGRSLSDCPFRYQGQYEDAETGLYYNRFRYYSPEEGIYLSQDPIGMAGATFSLYSYVKDTNNIFDPLGLDWNYRLRSSEGNVYYHGRASDNETIIDVARRHSKTQGTVDGARFGEGDTLEQITKPKTPYDTVRGVEQRGIEENPLLGKQKEKVRGNKINGMSEKKQKTIAGKKRLKRADALLKGRKPSQMPTLDSLKYSDC
jgi:RHS repeat-associated protein